MFFDSVPRPKALPPQYPLPHRADGFLQVKPHFARKISDWVIDDISKNFTKFAEIIYCFMKGIGPIGLWGILLFFFDQRKKKKRSSTHSRYRKGHPYQASYTSSSGNLDHNLERKKRDNLERMKKIASLYTGHTAEVISFFVHGVKRVETFRLLDPGNKVELRLNDGNIKVFAYGDYISELFPDKGSHLKEVMEKGIPFHAYLGGRDLAYRFDEDRDSCSIIVFYKLDGYPPTKVIIE